MENELFDEARKASERLKIECSENCGHFEIEHNAFDLGVEHGEADKHNNSYKESNLREIYEIGFSLGICSRN